MHTMHTPRWAFLGMVLAVATAFGLLAGGAIAVHAQNTTGTCTAPASGSTNCTLVTAVAVAPGGTLTATVTNPAGATITNVTPLPTGCTLTGAGSGAVTVTCTSASTGIPAGASLVEAVAIPSATTSVIEIVSYNANGPVTAGAGVPAQTSTTGSCLPATTPPGNVTCTNIPTATTVAGGTLTFGVLNQAAGGSVQITAASSTGNCPLTTTLPQPAAPAGSALVTFTCGTGQSIPAGATVSATVAVTAPASPFSAPSEQTISNANGPIAGAPAVPSPTQTTATFSVTAVVPTPQIVAINPASGAAGSTVTIIGSGLNGATAINFGATPGTNLQCNASGTQCTVNAPNLPAGTAASVAVTTPGGTSNAFTFTFTSLAPLTVQVSGPATGTVGQALSFTASATPSSGATISSYAFSFSDGGTASGQNVTHTFNSAGTFTVTATATDSAGATGTGSTTVAITTVAPPGVPVTYQPGWNIVAGPSGTIITGNVGPLYTFQAGNTAYQVISNGTPLVAGQGYWAFFSAATTVSLPIASPQGMTVTMPAGQFIQVGNPTNTTVSISGADAVDTFDPVANTYRTGVTTLSPGQGAWVFSYAGGPLTITPTR